MIGILCAMEEELALLKQEITVAASRKISGYTFTSGKICGQDTVICMCGVGKVNAALCAEAMILSYPVELVINSGVAGALQEPLKIGDIVVGADVVQYDVDTTALGDPPGFVSTVNRVSFPCDEAASDKLLQAAKLIEGTAAYRFRIGSGERFVSDHAQKECIIENFNAYACEMEAGAIAQVCFLNGVKCAIVRSISDASTGEHDSEYKDCMPIAARNSAMTVIEYLSGL